RREDANRHLGQLVLDQAEAAYVGAERFALLGVLQRNAENVLGAAYGARPKLEPADIQNVEGNDMAAADFTEYVLHRHLDIAQIDRGGGAALHPHLLFSRAAGDSADRALDQECRNFLPFYLGEDGEEIGRPAVGDPHFLAIEDVVRAIGAEV